MRVKWKRMICGRPALIVIQMQRGEKPVMFRQMAKHARLMTTSRYIERTAPHVADDEAGVVLINGPRGGGKRRAEDIEASYPRRTVRSAIKDRTKSSGGFR